MIKINLLPHREEERKKRQSEFYAMLGLAGTVAALVVILVGFGIGNKISAQEQRNNFIKTENAKLDTQIKEISMLKQEIEALKARQQAVEDLQGDRNQPVYLMDELVRQTPEGVYLHAFKQDGQRVVMNGYAQSNERVSEFLRNLSNNSSWLNLPELIEIRSTSLGQGKDAKKVFDFTVNVGIKRPRDKEQAAVASVSPTKP
ncbi:PilN domain-containing protein [Herminiimonas sp. CN]|uniref:PilN domain-containing protein n=1 Tax=Herminiimonas sp. CN TaxID=1349818 RepID=UPI000473C935|nr:PilN domain-containing protein [Herminiimonas sp. CN]